MREGLNFLHLGMLLSLLLHGIFLQSLLALSQSQDKKQYRPSFLVPIKVSPPAPAAVEERKPDPVKKKIIRITEETKVDPLPVSHIKKEEAAPEAKKEVKPVFGVTPETVGSEGSSGIGVRVGNTLMKEQEKEYTPPEKVKQYITTPLFEINSMPSFKARVVPEYPEKLKEEGIEGEVMLMITIDERGRVVDVAVKHSDHPLFSQAAVEAIKKCIFTPAARRGKPVAVELDIPIKFILDT